MSVVIQAAMLTSINTPLSIQKVDLVPSGPHQVTVRIHFAGINFYESLLIAGKYPSQSDFPLTLGGELSGEVSAIGNRVSDFKVGDRVFSFAQTGKGTTGSYATFANIDEQYLYHLPKTLSFEAGAAFPMIFFTAFTMLSQVKAKNDSTILVHSVAGGVGSTLAQLIRALYPSSKIIGTYSNPKKEKFIQNLGIDLLVNVKKENLIGKILAKFPSGVDIIFDPVGQRLVDTHIKLLKPLSGIWCSYGGYSGAITDHNLIGKLRAINGTLVGFLMWPIIEDKDWCQKQFIKIVKIMNKYNLLPKIDKNFPLVEANNALQRLEERKNIGKILLDCS